jgi:hypothetical protein
MSTIITAGNATNNGASLTSAADGELEFKTGTGAGTTALTLSTSQIATFASSASVLGSLTVSGTVTASGGVSGGIRSGTAVASTSGTSIDFTSLPTGLKRITVMLYDVSTNGSSPPQIQIGSGSFTTSGYTAIGQNGTTTQNSTTGFITTGSWAGTSIKSGAIVLTNITGNAWVGSGVSVDIPPGAGNASYCAGRVTIGGTLDRVRITTVNGTDTFDAGTINILYE